MTDRFALIQSLVDSLAGVPHRDDLRLDYLKRRTQMILAKLFGDDSPYLYELATIRFRPSVTYSTQPDSHFDKSSNSGIQLMDNLLKTALEDLQLSTPGAAVDRIEHGGAPSSNRIFVVHGHDEEMTAVVARTIESLDLEPVTLREQASGGSMSLIEKLEANSDVSSAVVLLSPDDKAYPKDESPDDAKLRPRQNVIFELGFFIGRLGRDRVFPVLRKQGDFEMLSDYYGVVYMAYNESSWKFQLAKELKAAGYDVDANKLL